MRRATAAFLLVAAVSALAFGVVAPADAKSSVRVTAKIDDQPLSGSKTARLNTRRPITLDLTIRNDGPSPVSVRAIRIDGRVAGLSVFGYGIATKFVVPAASTDRRRIDVDLLDLGDQVTGLIPAKLRLLDTRRHSVAATRFVADVRGSARSSYALLTLVLVVITGVVFGLTLLALARDRLSQNRFMRGALFLLSGIGIGFVLVFAVSVLRIVAPTSPRWQPLVALPAALFFVLGYLTPTPTGDDDWDQSETYEGHAGYDGYEGDREEEFAG